MELKDNILMAHLYALERKLIYLFLLFILHL